MTQGSVYQSYEFMTPSGGLKLCFVLMTCIEIQTIIAFLSKGLYMQLSSAIVVFFLFPLWWACWYANIEAFWHEVSVEFDTQVTINPRGPLGFLFLNGLQIHVLKRAESIVISLLRMKDREIPPWSRYSRAGPRLELKVSVYLHKSLMEQIYA